MSNAKTTISPNGTNPEFVLKSIIFVSPEVIGRAGAQGEALKAYLGQVTVTGSAAIAGMLQLMSGLVSYIISPLISTL